MPAALQPRAAGIASAHFARDGQRLRAGAQTRAALQAAQQRNTPPPPSLLMTVLVNVPAALQTRAFRRGSSRVRAPVVRRLRAGEPTRAALHAAQHAAPLPHVDSRACSLQPRAAGVASAHFARDGQRLRVGARTRAALQAAQQRSTPPPPSLFMTV